MIVLDASVLIAHLYQQDAHHRAAEDLVRSAREQELGVSPLTLAEILVSPTRAGRLNSTERLLRDLGLTEVPLPQDAARRLARLRVECGLKLPDCCVLLAAEQLSAAVATFDAALMQAAQKREIPVYR